ncbi:MAG: 23S rRNA (guanosine(2251)-2'-O)-methyltransferase RlmB [Chitinophagaceae bacterium]|nr:23S rRNA (guanosine(2251)-2'-O)-methyltransferase RlmB [Chitinophagaceae bacterium]
MNKPSGNQGPRSQFIYGLHPVEEALLAGTTIERIFIQKGISKEGVTQILRTAQQQEVPVLFVPIEKLNRMHRNHQGVAAVVSPVQFFKIDDILAQAYSKGELPLLIIADRITDVRNFGAIARTALCSGVHALIIPQTETAALNSDAVKASAGALNKIPVCREKNLLQLLKQLKLNGIQIVASEMSGAKFIFEADLKVPTAIIMGSEGEGIAPELLRIADEIVKIPMTGKFESLNVSVAAGMILYEVMKQRMVESSE